MSQPGAPAAPAAPAAGDAAPAAAPADGDEDRPVAEAPGAPAAEASARGPLQPGDGLEHSDAVHAAPLPASSRADATEMPLRAEGGTDRDCRGGVSSLSRSIKAHSPFIGIDQHGPNAANFIFVHPTREQLDPAMKRCMHHMTGVGGRGPKMPRRGEVEPPSDID